MQRQDTTFLNPEMGDRQAVRVDHAGVEAGKKRFGFQLIKVKEVTHVDTRFLRTGSIPACLIVFTPYFPAVAATFVQFEIFFQQIRPARFL